MKQTRNILIWGALGLAIAVPLALAATSPQLAWRGPIYIIAGFAGVVAMPLILLQPLLAMGLLPGLDAARAQWLHRAIGISLVIAVIVHVGALWLTSPPDVVDALLFVSPTPFAVWGVMAMWAIFAAALLATFRRQLGLRWKRWRVGHLALASVIVIGTAIHAILIQGTMETISKAVLCVLLLSALAIPLVKMARSRGR